MLLISIPIHSTTCRIELKQLQLEEYFKEAKSLATHPFELFNLDSKLIEAIKDLKFDKPTENKIE